jgi:hypothetical protein
MAETVYVLGAICSLSCAVLLFRQYQLSAQRLLLWSALCFFGLTVTNVFVFIDLVLVPDVDLHLLRWSITAASLSAMLFGLIWESK